MPSKKKKYNARFPAGRIKKIMQTDEEIGKVAQAVPVIISRTLELFVESLLKKAMQITSAKNAKTLTPTHMKQCILSESRFDFLKDLVKSIPDVSSNDDEFGTQSGNLSPGTSVSLKAFSGYSCFQFHQSCDSSSSKAPTPTSHSSSPPPPPPLPSKTHLPVSVTPSTSNSSQPKFYQEIPIGCDEGESISEYDAPSIRGITKIQHTRSQHLNNCGPPPNNKEENPSFLKTMSGCNIKQLNELKLTNCVNMSSGKAKPTSEKTGSSEEEEDEKGHQPEENGFHRDAKILAKTCILDEDYDT